MKKLKNLSLCMAACVCIVACTSKQQQDNTVVDILPYTVIPFEKGVENEKQVKLSDIAEKITFVPMETTDASLLNKVRANNIISVNGNIVIPCFNMGAFAFDENGKLKEDCTVAIDDTLFIGDLTNKNLIIDIPVDIKGIKDKKQVNT